MNSLDAIKQDWTERSVWILNIAKMFTKYVKDFNDYSIGMKRQAILKLSTIHGTPTLKRFVIC